jgi:hypothetical protein
VQVVPVPSKGHLQYQEPPYLAPDGLPLRLLQVLWWCQLRLACSQRYCELLAKEAQLCRLQALPEEQRPARVREFDRRGVKANCDRVGVWLGNSLAYSLFSQGPFCAALLVRVRSARPPLWPQHVPHATSRPARMRSGQVAKV